jgi:hypothetical protein
MRVDKRLIPQEKTKRVDFLDSSVFVDLVQILRRLKL